MRRLIPILSLLLAGCYMDSLRGHNIHMALDAVQSSRKPIEKHYEEKKAEAETEEEAEEIEQQKQETLYDLNDAEDRLRLAQRDWPAPKVKKNEKPVERETLKKPSEEDRYRRDAYAGEVYKRESRRKAWQRFTTGLKKVVGGAFSIIGWIIDIAIYVIVLFVIVVIIAWGRKLYGYGQFLVRLLPEIVPDKEKRRQIAGGTPVEAVYHKEKRKQQKAAPKPISPD